MKSVFDSYGKRIQVIDPQEKPYVSAIDEIKNQVEGYTYELNQLAIESWKDHNEWGTLMMPSGEATVISFNKYTTLNAYTYFFKDLVRDAIIEVREKISVAPTPYEQLSIVVELNGYFKNVLVRFGYPIEQNTDGNYHLSFLNIVTDKPLVDPDFVADNDLENEIVDEIENCLFQFIQIRFYAVAKLIHFLNDQYEILKAIIPHNQLANDVNNFQRLTAKVMTTDEDLQRNIVQPQQLVLPENFNLPKMDLKISKLDIRQTALLFFLLRENQLILNYSNDSLAKIVYALTGHSEQNLRTKNGFGIIRDILDDDLGTKTNEAQTTQNHNLSKVKDALSDIIKCLDNQMKKNIERS